MTLAKKKKRAILALLPLLHLTEAAARPALYKSFGSKDSLLATEQSYILGDDTDENVFYIPFSKIILAKRSDQSPDFTFTFLNEGLVIEAGVKLDYDRDVIPRVVQEIKKDHPQAKFRFYTVLQGFFSPTIKTSSAQTILDQNGSNIIPFIQNDRTTYLTFYFARNEADIIRASLASGGAFGINYFYNFSVVNVPQTISLSIDWDEVSRQTLNLVAGQKIPDAGIQDIVHELISRQTIRLNIVGESAQIIPAVNYLQEQLRQRCFNTSSFSNSILAPSFIVKNEGCSEGPSEFVFTTLSTERIQAAAGIQFFGFCDSHPQNFKWVKPDGTVVPGCPDEQEIFAPDF